MRDVDVVSIERSLTRLQAELGPIAPLRPLGEGFDSLAYVTPGNYVVRVARNQEAARAQDMETELLPLIRSGLPVETPDIRLRLKPSAGIPFGASVHKMIEGRQLMPEIAADADLGRITNDLAEFFVALHATPVADARSVKVPARGLPELAALRGSVMAIVERVFTRAELRTIERWWDELLADPAMSSAEATLVHADAWYVHLLADPELRRLVGVLDFGDAAIADPAADFAPLLYSGPDFAAMVVDAYRKAGGELGAHFDERLRRSWELREVEGLPYVARHLPREVPGELEKMTRGPIFDPTATPW